MYPSSILYAGIDVLCTHMTASAACQQDALFMLCPILFWFMAFSALGSIFDILFNHVNIEIVKGPIWLLYLILVYFSGHLPCIQLQLLLYKWCRKLRTSHPARHCCLEMSSNYIHLHLCTSNYVLWKSSGSRNKKWDRYVGRMMWCVHVYPVFYEPVITNFQLVPNSIGT